MKSCGWVQGADVTVSRGRVAGFPGLWGVTEKRLVGTDFNRVLLEELPSILQDA